MTYRLIAAIVSLSFLCQYAPASWADTTQPDVNFKIYNATPATNNESQANPADNSTVNTQAVSNENQSNVDANAAEVSTTATTVNETATQPSNEGAADGEKIASKVLQGYIRVVPSGTKIPIIMDTAVDSDTSQEGDEFSARTGEDLTIDGAIAVPAGSVIKGRIAQLNAPRRLDRSGSVAMKFDTVTTPDNRQIPIVANLVARGGVVHARRGAKDIVMETGIVTLPILAGLGIGLLAGGAKSGSSGSSKLGAGGGAMIGAGIGTAVGIAILLSKKGKKVDVRPGDEMKIELAEDLRMPM